MNDTPNLAPNSEKYNIDYIYDDELLTNRVLKPKDPKKEASDSIESVFHINLDEFKELYFAKLYYFKIEFGATEENFLDEYIDILGWVLSLYEWMPNEIQTHHDHIQYETKYNRTQFLKALEYFKKLEENFDRRKVIYPTEKKVNFLKSRLQSINKSKEAIHNPSDSDDNSKTKMEMQFFKIAERFNSEILSETQASDDELFEKLLNEATNSFIAEISENITGFALEVKLFYLNRLKVRLKKIDVDLKLFDDESRMFFCLKSFVDEDTPQNLSEYDGPISKDYLFPLLINRRKLVNYIESIIAIGNTETTTKNDTNTAENFDSIFNKEKKEFILELLEDLSITQDGRSILSTRKKSAMLGIVEALREKKIAPNIELQKLCKLIGDKIGLEIKYNLESSTTSGNYKSETEKYINKYYKK